jgi:AraC-like DNA-binding protein
VDEDDGNSTFTLNVDGEDVFTWIADINPTKDNIFTKTVKNLKLSHDSKLVITGVRNKGEGARLAHLEIKYVNGITPLLFMNHALSQFLNNISLISALLTIFVILLILVVNILIFIILRHRHFPRYSVSTPKSNPLPINTSLDNYPSSDIITNSTDHDESTKNELVTNYNPIPFVVQSESLNVLQEKINSVPDGPSKPLVAAQMISYIKTKYEDSNFSVQEMADHFNMSLNYLSSYFKEQTGQNIICYLTELRIEKAKQLLLSSDLAIKNVAECSGYFNVSSFIRRFKQIMGVTPGEYRLNSKNSNPVSKEDIL